MAVDVVANVAGATSLFGREFFQMAYVTNDLDRALTVMKARYGIADFQVTPHRKDNGMAVNIGLAWTGGTMIELIEASGPGTSFYTARLPSEGFSIRHHHVGYFVRSQADWDALNALVERLGFPVPLRTAFEGLLDALYVEAEELSHFLEFIRPTAAGVAYFDAVPRN